MIQYRIRTFVQDRAISEVVKDWTDCTEDIFVVGACGFSIDGIEIDGQSAVIELREA